MDEDALLAHALWAAEQAAMFEMYGSDDAADSDSDYEHSSKRRKQQGKKGKAAAPKPRNTRKPPLAPSGRSTAQQLAPGTCSNTPAAPIGPVTTSAAETEGGCGTATNSGSDAGADSTAAPAAAGGGVVDTGMSDACGGEVLAASGRRKRKDSGQKRERGKGWTPDEESSFLSGLEAHGRDWKAIAAGIGSRDARAVASHAQKHFIKLCMSGAPLPVRVCESGRGYTLSGNLLDPGSAAAAAYGFSYDLLMERLEGEQLATALSGIQPLDTSAAAAAAAAAGDSGGGSAADSGAARDQQGVSGQAATLQKPPAKRQRRSSCGSQQPAAQKPAAVSADQQQQQQQGSGAGGSSGGNFERDLVAAILSAAPLPPLAASEAAAKAATTAAGAAAGQGNAGLNPGALRDSRAAAEGIAGPNASAADRAAGTSSLGAADICAAGLPAADAAVPANAVTQPSSSAQAVQPVLLQQGQQAGAETQGVAPATVTTDASQAAAPAAAAVVCDGDWVLTEYARSRPRRVASGSRATQLGSTSESLELVTPLDFIGPVGGGGIAAQPYSLEVDLQAMMLMDIHVHLSGCEVIGLLGGSWDPQARRLRVLDTYPCRRVSGSDDATSVELDPASEVEARGAMSSAGHRCVGWYHSHPVFEPRPSRTDMDNQRNYQALTRDSSCSSSSCGAAGLTAGSSAGPVLEPFVGFILSPFEPALPLPHTSAKAFVVQQRGATNNLVPFNVRYGLINATRLPGPEGLECLTALLHSTKYDMARTDLGATWRPFTVLNVASGQLLGPWLSKLDKLLAGLRWWAGHVADRAAVEEWLNTLVTSLQEVWEVRLPALHTPKDTVEQQQEPRQQLQQQKEQQTQKQQQQFDRDNGDQLEQQLLQQQQQDQQGQQQGSCQQLHEQGSAAVLCHGAGTNSAEYQQEQ